MSGKAANVMRTKKQQPVLQPITRSANRSFAKLFRWTYASRPVATETVKRPDTGKDIRARCRAPGETLALVGRQLRNAARAPQNLS